MNPIENLIRQKLGLDASIIDSVSIERTVRSRMRHCELTKKDDYLKLIQTTPAEWEALVESVVITETWFFRDRASFQAMVRLVRDEWLPAHPDGALRLLSIPCSSGEEPFSMAMALMDSGLPADRFQIDALDISARCLAHADDAVYGKNSFRGSELDFRTRYFSAAGPGYRPHQAVRARVRFQKGNILDLQCLSGVEPYDVIFCRNLLIYLDSLTRNRILGKVRELLTPTGMLILGPAEVPIALNHGFASANHPSSFACRHPEFAGKSSGRRSKSRKPAEKPDQNAAVPAAPLPTPPTLPTNLTRTSTPASPPTDLRVARQLADEGRLAEAADICEAHLREHGVSAEAYYLLGLVLNAAGAESQAGEFYRKALYLEPDHYDTLIQWASLSKRHGNQSHARILQKRAERVKKQT